MIDETPQTQCPKCRKWQDDYDGFGVLKCEHCDYCSHPSSTLRYGIWQCGLCGQPSTVLAPRPDEVG